MIRRSTWVTLGIFAIVLVAAIIIRQTGQKAAADATPTPGSAYLFSAQDSAIIGLRITDTDENSVAVQRAEDGSWSLIQPEGEQADQDRIDSLVVQRAEDGSWSLIQPEGEQADQDRIDSLVSQAESLRVVSTLDTQPELTAIGLEPPQYRLSITLADGQQQVAEIGSTTPTNSGYYARLGGGDLQVVSKSGLDSLVGMLTDPPIAPTPTPQTRSSETPQP
ncbi:MAG: DUF4340 domain-containing protein [Anaerolineales bacterium]